MKILISAAEASSDIHGAELLKALQSQEANIEAFGMGGSQLQQAGLEILVDAKKLLVMGFTEILSRLPIVFFALRNLTLASAKRKPDLAIVIDYPEFHFYLAKRLYKLGIPTLYYIPPKVWIWRKKRIFFLKKFFSQLLCIFPFEEAFYRQFGISAQYIGNPLVDELPLQTTSETARMQLGLSSKDLVVTLMIGSRPSEWKHHLKLMLDTAQKTANELYKKGKLAHGESLKVLLPFPKIATPKMIHKRIEKWKKQQKLIELEKLDIRLSFGNSHLCLLASQAGLIKSGTSTLEAALLGCPHAVVYRTSWSTSWIFKYLIRYRGPVGLVNLILGTPKSNDPTLVSEFLCERANSYLLTNELICLLTHKEKIQKMKQGFEMIQHEILKKKTSSKQGASATAAKTILQFYLQQKIKFEKAVEHLGDR